MNIVLQSLRERYPEIERVIRFIQRNPQLGLVVVLFLGGLVAIATQIPAFAGSLFGAGAAMLGGWINEFNNRRSASEEKLRRQGEAHQFLAPELNRAIERALFIHGRAIPNFIAASAENGIKPNDLKEDFIPYWPVLYPNAPQFRDLSGDEAVALIAFYDSLNSLKEFVNDWWGRDGQLPVNIFLMILNYADVTLKFAVICIEKFQLERLYPPQYEAWGTVSSRIERSRASADEARVHHMARYAAKAANTTGTPTKV